MQNQGNEHRNICNKSIGIVSLIIVGCDDNPCLVLKNSLEQGCEEYTNKQKFVIGIMKPFSTMHDKVKQELYIYQSKLSN